MSALSTISVRAAVSTRIFPPRGLVSGVRLSTSRRSTRTSPGNEHGGFARLCERDRKSSIAKHLYSSSLKPAQKMQRSLRFPLYGRSLCCWDLKEREQRGIDFACASCTHPVWRTCDDFQRRVFDDFRGQETGVGDRNDLVGVTVQDQRRDIDLLEVPGEVGLGECLDAVVRTDDGNLHSLSPKRVPHAFGNLCVRFVVAVEGQAQILEELRAVRHHASADLVKYRQGQATRVVLRLQHDRRHCTNEDGLRHALGSVPANVTRNFAPSSRVPNESDVLQIELFDERGQVIRVSIHLVAIPRLAGAAVASAVVGNGAIAFLGEKQHLRVPRVRIQWPSMREHRGWSSSPVFEVDFRSVFRGDRIHFRFSLIIPMWIGKNFADVCADFVVILGVVHENRGNLLSAWAFGGPFLLLVRKQWFREWLRLL